MPTKKFLSPDRKIEGKLIEAGRIRFGPPYFELQIGPYDFSERAFGVCFLWSRNSRYLAVLETLTLDNSDGPNTELLLLDFREERQCPLSKVKGGYMVPLRFAEPLLIYEKQFRGRSEEREFEIEFESLDRWRPLTRRA